jgi:hypothetical protein
MRRLGFVVSLSLVFAAYGCGSSGGGGTGGSGGTTATGGAGGAGAKGGTTGTGGNAATGGTTVSGGAAGGAGAKGTGGAGGGAGTTGSGGAAGGAGSTGTGGTAGAAGATATGGAGGAAATCGTAVGSGDQCSSVTASATGPCVTPVMATGAVPTASGGTITAGTYELTATSVYVTSDAGQNGGGEEISRQTFIVSNVTSSGFTLQEIEVSGTSISRDEGTVAISGTTATFTKTCPPPGDGGDQGGNAMFTATANTVTLITNHGSTVVVQTFTKS